VWLDDTTPVGIESHRPLRSNAAPPVVFVRKASARPANIWNLDRLECSNNIVADAASVRDFGIWTNPDAFINAVSKMHGELAENVAVNLGAAFGEVDGQFDLLRS